MTDQPTRIRPEVTTVEKPCRGCEAPVTCSVLSTVAGRAVTGPAICPACQEREESAATAEREEAAELARQIQHDNAEKRAREMYEALKVPPAFLVPSGDARVPPSIDRMRNDWGSPIQQAKLARAFQVARRIVGEVSNGLKPAPLVAFIGAPGNGKTLLAWSIAADLAAKGKSAKVVKLAAMVRDLRQSWSDKSGPDEDERLQRYREVDFLAIDEVSRHAFYGKQIHQHLYDVLNDRLEAEKVTVLTTNEAVEGLAEILGPALMSRLQLGGVLDFGTEDYRSLPSGARAA